MVIANLALIWHFSNPWVSEATFAINYSFIYSNYLMDSFTLTKSILFIQIILLTVVDSTQHSHNFYAKYLVLFKHETIFFYRLAAKVYQVIITYLILGIGFVVIGESRFQAQFFLYDAVQLWLKLLVYLLIMITIGDIIGNLVRNYFVGGIVFMLDLMPNFLGIEELIYSKKRFFYFLPQCYYLDTCLMLPNLQYACFYFFLLLFLDYLVYLYAKT